MEKKERIVLDVEFGEKDKYFAQAKERGYKLTPYIIKLLENDAENKKVLQSLDREDTEDEILLKKYKQQPVEVQNAIRRILGMKQIKERVGTENC